MSTQTLIHVRLNSHDQEFLNEMTNKGYFANKSDVLRTALRLYQYSELCDQIKHSNPKTKTINEVLKELKQIRKKSFKRLFEES